MEMPELLEEMLRRIISKTPDTLKVHTRALVMLKMIEEGEDAD